MSAPMFASRFSSHFRSGLPSARQTEAGLDDAFQPADVVVRVAAVAAELQKDATRGSAGSPSRRSQSVALRPRRSCCSRGTLPSRCASRGRTPETRPNDDPDQGATSRRDERGRSRRTCPGSCSPALLKYDRSALSPPLFADFIDEASPGGPQVQVVRVRRHGEPSSPPKMRAIPAVGGFPSGRAGSNGVAGPAPCCSWACSDHAS